MAAFEQKPPEAHEFSAKDGCLLYRGQKVKKWSAWAKAKKQEVVLSVDTEDPELGDAIWSFCIPAGVVFMVCEREI